MKETSDEVKIVSQDTYTTKAYTDTEGNIHEIIYKNDVIEEYNYRNLKDAKLSFGLRGVNNILEGMVQFFKLL